MQPTVAITGPHPQHLGGFDDSNVLNVWIMRELYLNLKQAAEFGVRKFITGGALGVDTWGAQIIQGLRDLTYPDIHHVLAMPFPSQTNGWNEESIDRFNRIKEAADEVVVVSDDPYAPYKMQIRNEWMVDNCTTLIAVYDRVKAKGGTHNCVMYAIRKQKRIRYIDPNAAPNMTQTEYESMCEFVLKGCPTFNLIYGH